MASRVRRARDLGLLDALDAFGRETLDVDVWRVVRSGRDPSFGSPSQSRWCNGTFDVLYTSMERDGAIAEIHALLTLQPVFPSKDAWHAYRLQVTASRMLRLDKLSQLAALGVDTNAYANRDYARTQEIADAAFFIGFGGLIVPSARWDCSTVVLFTDCMSPEQIHVLEDGENRIDWAAWRKRTRR